MSFLPLRLRRQFARFSQKSLITFAFPKSPFLKSSTKHLIFVKKIIIYFKINKSTNEK